MQLRCDDPRDDRPIDGRPPTAEDGEGQRAELDLFARYLQEMNGSTRLNREEEVELGRAMREAGEALVEIFARLPEPWRCRVLRGAEPEDRSWTVRCIDERFERLVECAAAPDGAPVVPAAGEAFRHKEALDRARDAMIVANLPLVLEVAKSYGGRGVPFLDLVQEGNIGLIEAVGRFDPERGVRFATYGVWWIKRALAKTFAHKSRLIRLPENASEAVRKIRLAATELAGRLGRSATQAEIAAELGWSVEKITALSSVARSPSSLETSGANDDSPGPLNTLPDPRAADPLQRILEHERPGAAERALGVLTARERLVLELRFGIGVDRRHTLCEIGKILGVSRERVRQIEHAALERIRSEQSGSDES